MKTKTQQVPAFLAALTAVAASYTWEVQKDGSIVGRNKNRKRPRRQSPLSVVQNEQSLNLSETATANIKAATEGHTRRGYPQILRGKIRRTLGLS